MKRRRREYNAADRFQYLKELLHEFQVSQNQDAKRQVLANLANFCYDPINYEHIRRLNLICIFLDLLNVKNERFVEFSISGLCNLSVDPKNIEIIMNYDGIEKICTCIGNKNNEIKLSTLTTLIHVTNNDKNGINVIDKNVEFKRNLNILRTCEDQRVKNLVIILNENLHRKDNGSVSTK